ncbi:hypothetical protein AB1L30_00825 [Bremerella sp. JC817]|uniref:hypothetical protein n=1 Tax=Bremerella sp. JC817 TaxID=3231756 RepID=UPI00345A8AF4
MKHYANWISQRTLPIYATVIFALCLPNFGCSDPEKHYQFRPLELTLNGILWKGVAVTSSNIAGEQFGEMLFIRRDSTPEPCCVSTTKAGVSVENSLGEGKIYPVGSIVFAEEDETVIVLKKVFAIPVDRQSSDKAIESIFADAVKAIESKNLGAVQKVKPRI